MNDQWASENLQTIRTLMERSAVYRRALAPVMTVTGVIGVVAAVAGWKAQLHSPEAFVLYWLCVGLVALSAGVVLIRRQALQQGEPLWSPPTRRVARAMLPALTAGLILGAIVGLTPSGSADIDLPTGGWPPSYLSNIGMPLLWVILYGCAVHAAGFFMKRGIRILGWMIMLCGCAGFLLGQPQTSQGVADLGYAIMGVVFGLVHLAYGIYLFASEKRSPAK